MRFWAESGERKITAKATAIESIASLCGLHLGPRQAVARFAAELDAGLRRRSISKATATATADPSGDDNKKGNNYGKSNSNSKSNSKSNSNSNWQQIVR